MDTIKKFKPFARALILVFLSSTVVTLCAAFKLSNRAGILGESLHRYYISENSASYTFVPSRVESDQSLFICTKEYLLSYGEISKINEDYLYAIYLGLIQETLKVIYNTNLKFTEKLKYISDIFECQITKEMLLREADPQFNNLSKRKEFLQSVVDWIFAQSDWKNLHKKVEEVINKIDLFSYNIILPEKWRKEI
jgi:hypothetical protein